LAGKKIRGERYGGNFNLKVWREKIRRERSIWREKIWRETTYPYQLEVLPEVGIPDGKGIPDFRFPVLSGKSHPGKARESYIE